MPAFIGSLSQHEDQDLVASLLDPSAGAAGIAPPALAKRASWKPSGGKKLSTGLAIALENVAAGFRHPNVLDVKLGARLWDDDAPVSKRRKLDEVAGRTTSGSLGFRVAGMKIWQGDDDMSEGVEGNVAKDGADQPPPPQDQCPQPQGTEDGSLFEFKNGYKSYTKLYGQAFSQDNVMDAFTTYLGGVDYDARTGKKALKLERAGLLVGRFIRELESLQYVLETEESRMYGASVLMVYEGDPAALEVGIQEEEKEKDEAAQVDGVGDEGDDEEEDDDDDDEETIPQKVHEVRLIDFAHASWTPGQGPDENALQGLRNVLKILRDLAVDVDM